MKKTKIQMVEISRLQLNRGQLKWLPRNPRQWTQADIDKMARSLERDPDFVEERPVLATPGKGDALVVFAHNLLTESAGHAGRAALPAVIYTPENEDDRETIRRRALLDNGAMGRNDTDILANEWPYTAEELVDFGYADYTGETEEPAPATAQAQEDDFDETQEVEARCKAGDIWQLGNHRLMCGDSTDAAQVALLMNGEKADIAFTSPPYGVNDGGLRAHKEAGNNEIKPKNFYGQYKDGQDKWGELMERSFLAMSEFSVQQFINVQLLADNRRVLIAWAAEHKDRLIDVLIWDKGHAAPQIQPNIVNNNYEFIFVFGGVDCSRKLVYGDFKGNTDAVLRISTGQNEYAKEHGAVFPVELPGEILRINSKAQSVLDLFGGTGTTMIAAEQMERRCFMMELDSHYCDIILARWEKLTGQTARKLE